MKKIVLFLFIACSISAKAQIEKTIHQTFEIKDEVTTVALDIFDEFEVEEWAGNNIMAVAKV